MKIKSLEEVYEQWGFALVGPSSFDEAANHNVDFSNEEQLAMIHKNYTWEFFLIGVKCVYRKKLNPCLNLQA